MYLQRCATSVEYFTGFMVKQAYETWQRQSVRTIIGEVIRQHRIRVGTGKLDKRKARNGAAPNWIHSLDQDVVTLTVNDLEHQGVEFFNAVHDDIGVLAPDMKILKPTLLNNVADMFSENLLLRFFKTCSPCCRRM